MAVQRRRTGTRVVDPSLSLITAHKTATKSSTSDVVQELTRILGAQLVAYLGSVHETRAVREWMAGTREPRGDTPRRLRLAYQVAKPIADSDGDETAQAWFQGHNPLLGDFAPAQIIRSGDLDVDGPKVIAAQRHFLAA